MSGEVHRVPPSVRMMPDIASEARPDVAGTLDWVGMGEIEMPVTIMGHDECSQRVPARVSAYVNLGNRESRGIHMSRLYLQLDQALGDDQLNPASIKHLLNSFLESHRGLSESAMVEIAFDYLVRRPALKSENTGWKRYPVAITGLVSKGEFHLEVAMEVLYSSTCPCSAALARQLVQEKFAEEFRGKGQVSVERVREWLGEESSICATPHSQRSVAELRVRLAPAFCTFPFLELIDCIEGALKTPVQAAVKREDEQAFALLNGQNLMFCEDAGRRIKHALNDDDRILDFWARATHFESLHPHNAVSVVTKGVDGGYRSDLPGPGRLLPQAD